MKTKQTELAKQAFQGYPTKAKDALMKVRELIYETKRNDSEIGEINEALRWGELSFLTENPDTGSMIRLALSKSGEPAVFFHCGTTLVETFRAQYTHVFEFEANRALVLKSPFEDTTAELVHCLQQALRYKLKR